MRLMVWTGLFLLFAWLAFVYLRSRRCQVCHREFAVYRRRYRKTKHWLPMRLCRKHADEWDAKYSTVEIF